MVYLAKKNGAVVHHADQKAMMDLDGVTPDKTITDAEFEEAGGLVRIINNKIVLGKTAAEKAADDKQAQIDQLKAELAAIDGKLGAGRAIRSAVLVAAARGGIEILDVQKIKEAEDQADILRGKLTALS
jgi:hypothetical protein